MIVSRAKSDLLAQLQSSTLIMPMPRCSNRPLDSGSPWVSVDPAFLRECSTLYRSVRLVMLALIAFLTAPKSSRSESSSSDSHALHSFYEAHKSESEKLRADCRSASSASLRQPLASPRALSRFKVPPQILHQLNQSPRKTSTLKSIRAHAPPASLAPNRVSNPNSNRSLKLSSSPHRQSTSFFAAYRGIPSHSVIRPGFDFFVSASIAIAPHHILHSPKRQTPHLEFTRAHAPPSNYQDTDLYSFHKVSPLIPRPAPDTLQLQSLKEQSSATPKTQVPLIPP
jgi:hypothetical protein